MPCSPADWPEDIVVGTDIANPTRRKRNGSGFFVNLLVCAPDFPPGSPLEKLLGRVKEIADWSLCLSGPPFRRAHARTEAGPDAGQLFAL